MANKRFEKDFTLRAGYEITERTIDKKGQFLLPADIEVETWWTNLDKSDYEIIKLYHAHGECEQYHSDVKNDMDVERLPSGKFETNALVLELTIIAYNITPYDWAGHYRQSCSKAEERCQVQALT